MGRRSRSRSGSLDSWGRKRHRSSRVDRSDRDRDRNRDRERDRNRHRSRERGRSRSRSRSPIRRHTRRSPSPDMKDIVSTKDFRKRILDGDNHKEESKEHQESSKSNTIEPEISEEDQMRALLGFGGFDTTKGKEVDDNTRGAAIGASNVKSKREYRQYMNKRSNFMKPKPPPPMM